MFSKTLAGAVAAALVGLATAATAAEAQVPITVTSSANAGPGTLRAAINEANSNFSRSWIEFDLSAISGTVITPANDLPAITSPLEIDGYTQPGASPASSTAWAQPGVLIDAVNTTRALEITTDASVIRGLAIHDSSGAAGGPDGIEITGNENRIAGNHIGTDRTGITMSFPNLSTGVDITGQRNTVGGSGPEDANVIAGIDGDGVAIAANRNVVVGNRLGLPYKGGLGNASSGVSVAGNGNRIGSVNSGHRNVISANNGHGVAIAGNHNIVEGNYVGLDETGANGAGNSGDGVNVVGNENRVHGNTASGNSDGVFIDGTSNTVTFNALGTNAKMTAAVPNWDGVRVWAGNFNVIGGAEASARNVISGNTDDGVEILAGQANRVEGNRIGTNGDGVASLPNGTGVVVETGFSVIVDNLVSGNTIAGVKLDGLGFGPPPVGNVVDGNEVAGNGKGVVVEDSHNNAITANVISANLDDGVLIEAVNLPNANGNWLTGNKIADNGLSGVRIKDADENLVGQPDNPINTITGNGEDGVTVETGQDNAVANNSISDNGDLGIDLAADGATNNDGLLDLDPGPNGLQNHPTISGRSLVLERLDELPFFKSYTVVSWTLRSAASTDYRVELYGADACDASGRGEAPELVATEQVTTDATGLATGSVKYETAAVSPSIAATATVTDPNGVVLGASSELSPCG